MCKVPVRDDGWLEFPGGFACKPGVHLSETRQDTVENAREEPKEINNVQRRVSTLNSSNSRLTLVRKTLLNMPPRNNQLKTADEQVARIATPTSPNKSSYINSLVYLALALKCLKCAWLS